MKIKRKGFEILTLHPALKKYTEKYIYISEFFRYEFIYYTTQIYKKLYNYLKLQNHLKAHPL